MFSVASQLLPLVFHEGMFPVGLPFRVSSRASLVEGPIRSDSRSAVLVWTSLFVPPLLFGSLSCFPLVSVLCLPSALPGLPPFPVFQFSGMIGFIFFLELTAAVLAFLFQDPVRDWIQDFFLTNVKAYREDIDLQNLIDSLQKLNHCCGAKEPDDWNLNVYFNCTPANPSRERCGVPFSCCLTDPIDSVLNTQCGYDVRDLKKNEWDNYIYTKGCIPALEEWLPRNVYIVAGVFIVISLLQMMGIFFARTLIGDIEKVRFYH